MVVNQGPARRSADEDVRGQRAGHQRSIAVPRMNLLDENDPRGPVDDGYPDFTKGKFDGFRPAKNAGPTLHHRRGSEDRLPARMYAGDRLHGRPDGTHRLQIERLESAVERAIRLSNGSGIG